MPTDSITIWGKREQIEPLIKDLKGVEITDVGYDCRDINEPVVELTYDPMELDVTEIFRACHSVLGDLEAGEANGVGVSSWKKGKE